MHNFPLPFRDFQPQDMQAVPGALYEQLAIFGGCGSLLLLASLVVGWLWWTRKNGD